MSLTLRYGGPEYKESDLRIQNEKLRDEIDRTTRVAQEYQGKVEELTGGKQKIQVLLSSATDYYRKGQYKEALISLQEVLGLDSANIEAKQFIEKIKIEQQQRVSPEVEQYYNEGLKAYREGLLEEALTKWSKALELDPENEKTKSFYNMAQKEVRVKKEKEQEIQNWYQTGVDYFLKEEYNKAVKEFEKILAINPQHQQAKEMIEKCKSTEVRTELPVSTSTEVGVDIGVSTSVIMIDDKPVEPRPPTLILSTSTPEIQLQQIQPTTQQMIAEQEPEVETKEQEILNWYQSGGDYFLKEEYNEAVKEFEKILAIDPQHQQAKEMITKCKSAGTEILPIKQPVSPTPQVIREDKNVKERETKVKELLRSSSEYLSKGQYKDTILTLRKVIELDPNNTQAKQMMDKVKKDFKTVIDSDVEKYYTEGLKAYHDGNYTEAISKWNKALELNPDKEEVKTSLKTAEKELRIRQGLETEIQKWYKTGTDYYLQEEYDLAIKEFEKILEVTPNHEQAKMMIDRCKARKK